MITIMIKLNLIFLCAFNRKSSPDMELVDMEQRGESIQASFECEPVEQLSGMEVDDIDISNDDELKSDKENDLYPMANNPFVESIQSKNDNLIGGEHVI